MLRRRGSGRGGSFADDVDARLTASSLKYCPVPTVFVSPPLSSLLVSHTWIMLACQCAVNALRRQGNVVFAHRRRPQRRDQQDSRRNLHRVLLQTRSSAQPPPTPHPLCTLRSPSLTHVSLSSQLALPKGEDRFVGSDLTTKSLSIRVFLLRGKVGLVVVVLEDTRTCVCVSLPDLDRTCTGNEREWGPLPLISHSISSFSLLSFRIQRNCEREREREG